MAKKKITKKLTNQEKAEQLDKCLNPLDHLNRTNYRHDFELTREKPIDSLIKPFGKQKTSKEVFERFIEEFIDALNNDGTRISLKYLAMNIFNSHKTDKMLKMSEAYNLVLKRGSFKINGHNVTVRGREELDNPYIDLFEPALIARIKKELKKRNK
jgi:hypothetical protein